MKKMNKRKVFVVALALCLVAILSTGSLAWFNATDTITNEFKVATSQDDPTKVDFSIDVFEHNPDGSENQNGLTFDAILPGMTYAKDPTVKNTGFYNEYVRVFVTVSDAAAWTAACAKYGITDLTTIFGGYVDAKWTLGTVTPDTEADTLTYEYYLNRVLSKGGDEVLFTSVTIPYQFTVEDMETLLDFTLTVKAEAIQADALPDTVTDAQGAFALLTPAEAD